MGVSRWEVQLVGYFPRLASEEFKIVGPHTKRYNCIAFAAGDTNSRWDDDDDFGYWPESATRSASIDSLKEVFAAIGFEQCAGSGVEPGFEKVALYEQQGQWTHAAKQTPNGTWRSKMGDGPVIEHLNPESLAGGPYGHPTIYMRKQAMPPNSETGPREEPTRV